MKKLIISAFAAAVLLVANSAVADHHESKDVTLKGEAKCAKCAWKKSDKCADVLQVKGDDGKVVTYWLAKNTTSKPLHKSICQDTVKLTATGRVAEFDGKTILVASKLTPEKK